VPGQSDEHYADFAERVRRILETYTPAVETAALDDFYLDFAGTERLYPNYETALRRVQSDVLEQTGLSVSVGAARTKVVASIASRLERPARLPHDCPGNRRRLLDAAAGRKAPRHRSCPRRHVGGAWHRHHRRVAAGAASRSGGRVWRSHRRPNLGTRPRPRRARSDAPSTPKSVSRETTIEGGTIDTEFSRRPHRISERTHRLDAARIRPPGAHHRPAHPLRRPFFRSPNRAFDAPLE